MTPVPPYGKGLEHSVRADERLRPGTDRTGRVKVAEEQPVRREAQLRRSFVTIFMVLAIGGTIGSLAYPVFYSYRS
ncbi:hypothetical protein [Streptomyces sp. NBC_00151]|uniref:hypothetical protein n=1 Tax=Streptomyces sp. NBC_00151 TaxID=2975669 RepID=UPI002DDC38FD|nr:hypothetical protein [Streptomyces sp. NBC_00151]WRZ40600.1 hypothetical protein OG915_22630 [Streptomyces sp. NBC_00151]